MANPYSGGGNATTGGGGGSWSTSSTNTTSVSLPNISELNSFTHTFNITATTLNDIGNYLMGDDPTTTDGIKEILSYLVRHFTKTDEAVVAIYMLPVAPTSNVLLVTGNKTEYGISFGFNRTKFSGKMITKAITIACGSVTVDEYSGSFLDYNEDTQISLYLPYIGTVQLDANIVMGKTITVSYNLDPMTGNVTANVLVKLDGTNNTLMYSYNGNCSYQIAFSSINYTDMILRTIGASVQLAAAARGMVL